MKLRGAFAAGGSAPVGNQAATFNTDRGAYPAPGGMDNPRILLFWIAFVGVLFIFHVGGARLP